MEFQTSANSKTATSLTVCDSHLVINLHTLHTTSNDVVILYQCFQSENSNAWFTYCCC